MRSIRKEHGKVGCFGIILITLGVIILGAGIGGYLLYTKGKELALDTTAMAVEMSVSQMLKEVGYKKSEREDIMKPVSVLADDIRAGNVGLAQAATILQELNGPMISSSLFAHGFDNFHIETTQLEPDEKQLIRRYLQRFSRGLVEETIPNTQLLAVNEIISTSTTDADGTVHVEYKKALTEKELMACLQIFMEAVKAANIPDEPYEVDLSGVLQEAITAGMAAKKMPVP